MSTTIIVVIVFAVLMFGMLYCGRNDTKFLLDFSTMLGVAFITMVLIFVVKEQPTTIPETEVEPNVYFVYAEKASEKDGVVTFATVNLKDNQFYTWVSEYETEYPDVPYMLTMDSKGTATLEDDEILVVWANNN